MINIIRKVLESKLTGYTTLPFVYDNSSNGADEFIRCTLEAGNSQPSTIASTGRLERITGYYVCSVYIKAGQGVGRAFSIADDLALRFRNKHWVQDGCAIEITAVDYDNVGESNGKHGVNLLVRYRASKYYTV